MTKLESVVVPKNSGRAFVVKKGQGDQLMSKLNNPMLTVEDTFKEGRHDLQKRMCSRKRFDLVAQGLAKRTFAEGVDPNPKKPEEIPDHGCLENLSEAVKTWNISPEDIPSPFNIFQMHVHRSGDRHHVQHDDSSEGRSACRLSRRDGLLGRGERLSGVRSETSDPHRDLRRLVKQDGWFNICF